MLKNAKHSMESAELSEEQDFIKLFQKRKIETLSTADFTLLRLAANWTEKYKGGCIHVGIKMPSNTPVRNILFVVICVVTVFGPRRQCAWVVWRNA